MKKITIVIAVILFLINVTGCNTDDDNVSEAPQNIPVEENGENSEDDTNQKAETSFNFTHFDLDVDYSGNEEFEVDYENERDEVEAEIKDNKSNNHLKGDEALVVLIPIFEQLTFDKDTPDEDVISEVINAFDLEENFQEFELEVKFLDGTEKEYEVRQ